MCTVPVYYDVQFHHLNHPGPGHFSVILSTQHDGCVSLPLAPAPAVTEPQYDGQLIFLLHDKNKNHCDTCYLSCLAGVFFYIFVTIVYTDFDEGKKTMVK